MELKDQLYQGTSPTGLSRGRIHSMELKVGGKPLLTPWGYIKGNPFNGIERLEHLLEWWEPLLVQSESIQWN
mgnify:CR=1 FL=1